MTVRIVLGSNWVVQIGIDYMLAMVGCNMM